MIQSLDRGIQILLFLAEKSCAGITELAEALVPWLECLSGETGLRYGRVAIKGQQTRWGSCSARGTISLNQDLLFIPPELVRYIMVHELCHTRHMDHSPKFWTLLESFEPGCRALDARMKHARNLVPLWARRR